MPRSFDHTFHKLLWITLLAVALTFTVILTGVFVDIDDLLAKRSSPSTKQQSVTETPRTELPEPSVGYFQGFPSSEDDTEENESTFRTKRSLGPQTKSESNNHVHIKSPKIKKILTNRLATLLEELDEEESSQTTNGAEAAADFKDKNTVNTKYSTTEEDLQKKESVINIKDTNSVKTRAVIDHKDILHLAMHNVILQGIIGHMDLNEVYKKIHLLIQNFDTNRASTAKDNEESKIEKDKPTELMRIISHDSYNEEDKFINELSKCKNLKKQILQSQDIKTEAKKGTSKDSHMIIKTLIEITNTNGEPVKFKTSNDNVTGAVKLIYNGKEIKSPDDQHVESETIQNPLIEDNQSNIESLTEKIRTEAQNLNKSEIDEAIAKYLKTHSIKFHNKYNIMSKGTFVAKRLKRQIKIRYLNDQVTTQKSKRSKGKSNKHQDDELYVEIETHFDGKGTKGEKKKKLVRNLIDKIQKAINSNGEILNQDKTFQRNHLQIKKRIQNPIDHKQIIINASSPVEIIEQRQLSPISKTANTMHPLTSVLDRSGDTWKKKYNGPGFLTVSKSLNSAEMRELDIDYNSVMKNGVPKRLQKPINTENNEFMKFNEYSDNMGNVTLLLKDINGSGFSIGINQYSDEPPDKETLKMFTGLENLIRAYHEHYDQNGALSNESIDQSGNIVETNHERNKRELNKQWFMSNSRNDPNRYERSAINVKLFSNIKTKTKLNKFINTNPMATKKLFLKSKRNKRQIDKIKILASDRYAPSSREDIFLVSRENIYADRAIVKEEEPPEVEIRDRDDEHYDFIAPYPYIRPDLQPAYSPNIYSTKSLHNGLMSKYPHIFLENISRSKEEFININPTNHYGIKTFENQNNRRLNAQHTKPSVNYDTSNEHNISSTNIDEIVNAILPSRNNFKVVVKILPKNNTNINPGYKEVHTLINKSYDKNGLRYVSTLNVSEVSKYESLNKTKTEMITTTNDEMKLRQNQIKSLLQLHKERIDQQLEHLKMESQKLKQMIGNENIDKNISHLINVFKQLGLKPIYGQNYSPLHDNKPNVHTTALSISNTFVPKIETTTTINKEDDPDKAKILTSIKENENITRTILQKIDKNTDILQLLSRKLWDQPESTHPQAVAKQKKVVTTDNPKYLIINKIVDPYHQLQANFSNAIPFIYAFQQPVTENKDKLKSVADVIYHGPIHVNKIENAEKKNSFSKNIAINDEFRNNDKIAVNKGVNGNETKFFIDELENDFKLVANVNDRIPVLGSVKTNSSKT